MKWAEALAVAVVCTGAGACILPVGLVIAEDEEWEGVETVRGSGVLASRVYSVSGFDGISTWGVGTTVVRVTGRERVTVSGDDNLVPLIDVRVQGGTLEIGPASQVSMTPRHELVFDVEVVDVSRVAGSGAVRFDLELGGQDELWAVLSGASTLTGAGSVDRLQVVASGASAFRGTELYARRASVVASGASTVFLWAGERLDGSASGVASIHYHGNPIVSVAVSGLASLSGH